MENFSKLEATEHMALQRGNSQDTLL